MTKQHTPYKGYALKPCALDMHAPKIHFNDSGIIGYYVMCPECHHATNVYPTIEGATVAWNKKEETNDAIKPCKLCTYPNPKLVYVSDKKNRRYWVFCEKCGNSSGIYKLPTNAIDDWNGVRR